MFTFKDGKENFGRKSTKETVEILFAGDFCPATPESRKLIRNGIKTVGAGKDIETAAQPLSITKNGIKKYLAEWPQENELGKIKDFLDDTSRFKTLLILKNIFNCETHHEITANYLRLIEDKKLEVAEKYVPKYVKYKNADFGS